MMSANPHSGIHEAQVAKTLDTTVPTPQKAQGGQMIVETTNSNGGDVMPTLTTEIAHQTGAHMGFSGGYLLEHRKRPGARGDGESKGVLPDAELHARDAEDSHSQ